jgi:hypothetical protein
MTSASPDIGTDSSKHERSRRERGAVQSHGQSHRQGESLASSGRSALLFGALEKARIRRSQGMSDTQEFAHPHKLTVQAPLVHHLVRCALMRRPIGLAIAKSPA